MARTPSQNLGKRQHGVTCLALSRQGESLRPLATQISMSQCCFTNFYKAMSLGQSSPSSTCRGHTGLFQPKFWPRFSNHALYFVPGIAACIEFQKSAGFLLSGLKGCLLLQNCPQSLGDMSAYGPGDLALHGHFQSLAIWLGCAGFPCYSSKHHVTY